MDFANISCSTLPDVGYFNRIVRKIWIGEISMAWLIGISGLCGVGKTSAAMHLENAWGCKSIYLGQYVLDEVRARELPETPESERQVQSVIRTEHGPARLAMNASATVKECLLAGFDVTIDAIFRVEEYSHLCSLVPGARTALLSIHAPFDARCSRLAARPQRPLTVEAMRSRDENEVVNIGSARVLDGFAPLRLHH